MFINLLFLAVVVVCVMHVNSHERNANFVTVEQPSLNNRTIVSDFRSVHPTIESILDNPAVYKKQISRNLIQAIGYREGRQEHFIIHFRKEQFHGEWKSFYSNNQLCDSGYLKRNLPDGEWKTWYPNGQLKTVRNYSTEKYHYIKADLLRNHPKFQRYAITRYAVLRQNTAQHFKPKYEHNDAISHPSSMLQKIYSNTAGISSTYLPPFKNCVHHGTYINYHQNGAVKDSGFYVNGLKHGLWRESVNSDSMYTFGSYNHGLRNTQWKYYDNGDRLIYTEYYKKNGEIRGRHYFERSSPSL